MIMPCIVVILIVVVGFLEKKHGSLISLVTVWHKIAAAHLISGSYSRAKRLFN
jgi:hypothetical protein